MDLTDPVPEPQADSEARPGSNFITVDRLAVTGLCLTLVLVTGPDPGCLLTMTSSGNLLS